MELRTRRRARARGRGRRGSCRSRLVGPLNRTVQLAGESSSWSSIRETGTIIGEVPVWGKPAGPAVGEGSVWVGNREDNTLLEIDPRSLDVVQTIGLSVAPTDVEVGAASVWVLSDWALLRIDPAINDVVDTVPLPQGNGQQRWSHLEVGANAVFVCTCATGPGTVIRIDAATLSVEAVRKSPVWMIAYGEGALWALTGESLIQSTESTRKRALVVETTYAPRNRARAEPGGVIEWQLAKVRSGCWRPRPCGGSMLRPSVSWGAFRSGTARKAAASRSETEPSGS